MASDQNSTISVHQSLDHLRPEWDKLGEYHILHPHFPLMSGSSPNGEASNVERKDRLRQFAQCRCGSQTVARALDENRLTTSRAGTISVQWCRFPGKKGNSG